jgi:hypothetical protein
MAKIDCDSHGSRGSAIVCRHHLDVRDRPAGFIENSDDPDDLQAWCDACEDLFLRERDKTERFLKFNSFAVVCVDCYAQLRERHLRASFDA